MFHTRIAPAPHRNYTYDLIIPPAIQPISLDLAKQYLNIRPADTSKDTLIDLFIAASTQYAENLTRRDFIGRTYRTFRDFFTEGSAIFVRENFPGENYYNIGWLLRRSPLISVESVSYLTGGIITLIADTVYYNTFEKNYSSIILNEGQSWPSDKDRTMQSIIIDFRVGFGELQTDVPAEIQNAILQIISALYNNRGDCSQSGACDCATLAPIGAKSILMQNRIESL